MKNFSRKLGSLFSRRGQAAVVFAVLLFGIAGCDNGSDNDPPSSPTVHEPKDIEAFKTVLTSATTGISAETELVYFKLNWQLTEDTWKGILTALDAEGRYVSLDLSACTAGTQTSGVGLWADGTFAPNAEPTKTVLADIDPTPGKDKIVKLVLPTAAKKIPEGSSKGGAFINFLSLAEITGKEVTEIGNNAFYMDPAGATPNLIKADFPKVTTIGERAFSYCYSLPSLSLPEATTIGTNAFAQCGKLTSISLPKAESIGNTAFNNCDGITSISLPKAKTIGTGAFTSCDALTTIELPEATEISVTSATTATSGAFNMCPALVEVKIPKVENLGSRAFLLCNNSQPLVITMGATAPVLGINIFDSVTSRGVTVKTPASPTGYTDDWKTGLKGKGWDGTTAGAGTENTGITVTVSQ